VIDIAIDPDSAGTAALSEAFSDPGSVDGEVIASISTPELPASGSAQLSTTIDSAALDELLARSGWGAHAVTASLRGADDASSVSALVRLDGDAPSTLDVTVVLPLTAPPSTDGLIPADALEDYTGPNGRLTRKLNAVTDPAITLALDPRILASIRVLGVSAPESATAWLSRLEDLPNEIFPLQYADADPALEQAAGVSALLGPITFQPELDPANFPAPATPSPVSSDPASSTPTDAPVDGDVDPTATGEESPVDTGLPTDEELVAFEYSATDIAWPASGRATQEALAFAAQTGLNRTIVSSSQLEDESAGVTATVGGSSILVADEVSALVSDAVFALGASETRFTASRAAGMLAASADDADSERADILITLDRSAMTTADPTEPLRNLLALPWLNPSPLSTVSTDATTSDTALVAGDDDRLGTATALLQDEAAVAAFATVVEDPSLIAAPARLDLLGAFSAGWDGYGDRWSGAVETLRARSAEIVTSISIDRSSQINVFSYSAPTPISVTNSLPYPVTVSLRPRVSNARIVMDSATATIGPESTQRVLLDSRAVANGRVTVTLTMWSPANVPVGNERVVQLDVQPFWETAGIAVIVAFVVFLLGFGTFRSVRRRRRTAESTEVES